MWRLYEAWEQVSHFWLNQWKQYNEWWTRWLGVSEEPPLEKQERTIAENSNGQMVLARFAELQRLSRYYLLRKQVQGSGVDLELENILLDLYVDREDEEWEWYPSLQQLPELKRLVRENPGFFELEGNVMTEEGEYEYTLLALGIRSKRENNIIRRAVVTAYRKQSEAEIVAYLRELEDI